MKPNKKTALISGAGGFVGANLARELIGRKFDIHILIKKDTNTWRLKDIKNQLIIHIADITNLKSLKKLTNKIKPNYIFHLAAYGSYSSQTNVKKMISTNITGTYNLLDATKEIDYQCFVNTGSSSEYGFKKIPMREIELLVPESFYAATKASSTLICQAFAKIYNKPIITFRLFSVYGPLEEKTRFIPTALIAALFNKTLHVPKIKISHDFVFIDDVISAYILTTKKRGFSGEILNIGSSIQYTNFEVAELIKQHINPNIKISIGTFSPRSWDTNFWQADIKRAKKVLGWYPKFTFQEGLIKTINWLKTNPNIYQNAN